MKGRCRGIGRGTLDFVVQTLICLFITRSLTPISSSSSPLLFPSPPFTSPPPSTPSSLSLLIFLLLWDRGFYDFGLAGGKGQASRRGLARGTDYRVCPSCYIVNSIAGLKIQVSTGNNNNIPFPSSIHPCHVVSYASGYASDWVRALGNARSYTGRETRLGRVSSLIPITLDSQASIPLPAVSPLCLYSIFIYLSSHSLFLIRYICDGVFFLFSSRTPTFWSREP